MKNIFGLLKHVLVFQPTQFIYLFVSIVSMIILPIGTRENCLLTTVNSCIRFTFLDIKSLSCGLERNLIFVFNQVLSDIVLALKTGNLHLRRRE